MGVPTARPMMRPVLDDKELSVVVVTPLATTLEDVTVNAPPILPLEEAAEAKPALETEVEAAVPEVVVPDPNSTTDPKAMDVKVTESTKVGSIPMAVKSQMTSTSILFST